MLIDANLLLYVADRASVHHPRSASWFTRVLNGDRRVGLPMQSLGAFVRIITNPRSSMNPLAATQAQERVRTWLNAGPTWVPPAGERTAGIFCELVERHQVTANFVPDAMLAALAIEHGLTVMSADTDFARFPEVRWENPLAK